MWVILRRCWIGLGLAWWGLVNLGCSRPEEARPLRLNVVEPRRSEATAAPQTEGLRFAIAPIISPRNTLIYYRELLDYVEAQLGENILIKQRPTYAEVNELLRQGELEAAFLCSGPYVEAHDEFGAELLVSPEIRGQASYRAYVVVRADSPARRFQDLRGASFALVDTLSLTGYLAPCHLLAQQGENPRTFFGRVLFTHAHDKSLDAVAHQLVEGAAVSSLVYDYLVRSDPELMQQVRILERSEPYATPPVVVRADLEPRLQKRLRTLFQQAHEDPAGRAILAKMGIDRFVLLDDRAYANVRAMKRALQSVPLPQE